MIYAKIQKILSVILTRYMKLLEVINGTFMTFHSRPKKSSAFGLWSDSLKTAPVFAVVVQGPLVKDSDFTLETLKIYKKIFADAILILSTWETEEKEYIQKIREEMKILPGRFEMLLNKIPESSGFAHRNYQIVSTYAGIKKAEESGAEYVLKTRADQRMYAPNILPFLHGITKTFPIKNIPQQKERIVGVSLNSYKYRPYGLSDMNIFGQIDDMLLYWNNIPDGRDLKQDNTRLKIIEYMKAGFCTEVYLSTRYLKNIGADVNWTLEDSWRKMADYFCVVDQHSLNLYWHKYDRHQEYKYMKYGSVRNCAEFTFREWLHLYCNHSNLKNIPESALDAYWRGTVNKPE